MEDFGLCLENHSVGNHIKYSAKCCLKMTIAFVAVVVVGIVLALLNISPSLNDVLAVVIVIDSVLLIISFICWAILCYRKKRLQGSAVQNQEGFEMNLRHGCTTDSAGSNIDVHQTSVRNELHPRTLASTTSSRDIATRPPPLKIVLSRENDPQDTSPDIQTSDTGPSTSTPNESGKEYTFYYNEDEDTWKFKHTSSSSEPSKSEFVRNELLPSTSVSSSNSYDLASRKLPPNANLFKENDPENSSPEIKTSDSVQSTPTPNERKPYTVYYDEDLKIFTYKTSPLNFKASESRCCVPKCWPRSMKPDNKDRPTSFEKNGSFESETIKGSYSRQNSKELEGGYMASFEDSYSSLERSQHSLKFSQTVSKHVKFADEVEHFASEEESNSNRDRNEFCEKDFPTAEKTPLTFRKSSEQDFRDNKRTHLTSDDETSSDDCGENRGCSRQRPKYFPRQKKAPDIAERPSLTMGGTMNCRNLTWDPDHIQSSSTAGNNVIFPQSPDTDFDIKAEHLTLGEENISDRDRNQFSGQGLLTTEDMSLAMRESSVQDFRDNKRTHLTSDDETSSDDCGENRGCSRQRPKYFPRQKKAPDIAERPSLTMGGTMNCRNCTWDPDQIQSSSTAGNNVIFPQSPDTNFDIKAEHLTLGEENISDRDRNQFSGQGLTAEDMSLAMREPSVQDLRDYKRGQWTSSDGSRDHCGNRDWQRQRSKSLPSRRDTLDGRPSLVGDDTMNCRNFTWDLDQIQSSSSAGNNVIFPQSPDTDFDIKADSVQTR